MRKLTEMALGLAIAAVAFWLMVRLHIFVFVL